MSTKRYRLRWIIRYIRKHFRDWRNRNQPTKLALRKHPIRQHIIEIIEIDSIKLGGVAVSFNDEQINGVIVLSPRQYLAAPYVGASVSRRMLVRRVDRYTLIELYGAWKATSLISSCLSNKGQRLPLHNRAKPRIATNLYLFQANFDPMTSAKDNTCGATKTTVFQKFPCRNNYSRVKVQTTTVDFGEFNGDGKQLLKPRHNSIIASE